MKNKLIILSILSVVWMSSCKKQNTETVSTTEYVTLTPQELFQYELLGNGWEITTAPTHATSNEIVIDNNGNQVYNYTAGDSFDGEDRVVMQRKDSGNCHRRRPPHHNNNDSLHINHPCDSMKHDDNHPKHRGIHLFKHRHHCHDNQVNEVIIIITNPKK